MIAYDFLHLFCLGGLCGFFGQLVRILVGIKKAHSTLKPKSNSQLDGKRLIISSVLGFFIGSIALVLLHKDADEPIPKNMIITLMAIGYSGVDLIEGLFGFFKKTNSEHPKNA